MLVLIRGFLLISVQATILLVTDSTFNITVSHLSSAVGLTENSYLSESQDSSSESIICKVFSKHSQTYLSAAIRFRIATAAFNLCFTSR